MNTLFLVIKMVAAVLVGGLIGGERARHGRAAGMRTHILVCLGAALTSATSLFVADILGNNGDVFRISAQVISGVGFLGAGMIILRNNNRITGLTTAAGVWTTGAIGVAIGYGFYAGAAIVTLLELITIVFLPKLETQKLNNRVCYAEIDDLTAVNDLMKRICTLTGEDTIIQTVPPKSGKPGHLGLQIMWEKHPEFGAQTLCELDHVVFAVSDDI